MYIYIFILTPSPMPPSPTQAPSVGGPPSTFPRNSKL